MKSLIMYQFEGTNDATVSSVFSKFCPAGADKSDGKFYQTTKMAPDFCRFIGLTSQNNSNPNDKSHLEEIADLMQSEKYEKKMNKFEKKCNKIQSKIISAKREVSTSQNHAGMGGLGFMGGNTIANMVEKADQQQVAIQSNDKVAKAQEKFEKFVDKNKMLAETKQYTKSSGFGGVISFGDEPKQSNIYDAVSADKPKANDAAMKRLVEFLDELLKVSKEVSIMNIADGEKRPDYLHKRKISLSNLTADMFINMRNREMFVISR